MLTAVARQLYHVLTAVGVSLVFGAGSRGAAAAAGSTVQTAAAGHVPQDPAALQQRPPLQHGGGPPEPRSDPAQALPNLGLTQPKHFTNKHPFDMVLALCSPGP